ncbi:hypothetical protein RDWZM_002282 [Blomia tropicalis]|uniref:Peptidase C1A papain C-terminal domain-containing protein n=1 Tax=Blomia tropicalis TaxID=40697 RepID=A0A9Q0MFV0_BLOTA|nr:hypothetical protein RDWZM_002282 [Blomia tropicalis]
MISRCLNQTNSSSVRFGYTEMSDLSVKQLSDRNGLTTDSSIFSFLQRLFGNRSGGTDDKCKASDQSVPDNFDWRERNAVTSVKDQQDCGSCWAFATVAAIESALIIGNKASVDSIDGSEQNLVNCVSNGCDGGTSYNAFNYVKKNSVGKESNIPYKAKEESCSNPDDTLPIINDYCIRSKRRYTSSMQSESLSDKDMQQTLVKFGPLYIGVDADPLSYRNYRSGIVDDRLCSERINHAVLLVGYTPDAWIIKNSWGKNWGEEGYFRVARGKNMCGVNTEMAWPTPY